MMKHADDTPVDHARLLDRRGFLGEMGTGLGSIALACRLSEEAAAQSGVSKSPIRADDPLAPRPAHFKAAAKRVLQIFCPGAASHLDLWECKPELEKRHGEPLPGLSGANSFQGGN